MAAAGLVNYVAGDVGGVTDDLAITDSVGASVTSAVAVGPALTLSPSSVSSPVGGTVEFSTAGGASPICFGLGHLPVCDSGAFVCPGGSTSACLADGGSCITSSGAYVAGAASAGSLDWVLALDANGVCAHGSVQVGSALEFESPESALAPGQGVALAVSGGLAPYQIQFAPRGNLSGGAVTSLGQYTAGPNANTIDTLTATDSAGVTSSLQIKVGDPESDLPSAGTYFLLKGDFNGDQADDLLAISDQPTFRAFEIILGGPQFMRTILVTLPLDVQICAAAVADLNGDGIDDVILGEIPSTVGAGCTNTFVSTVQVYLGTPTGNPTVGPVLDFTIAQNWNSLTGLAAFSRDCGQPSRAVLVVPVNSNSSTCTDNCDRVLFLSLPADGTGPFDTELGLQPFEELGGIDLPTNSFQMWTGAACPADGGDPIVVLSSAPLASTGCTPAQTYDQVNLLLTGVHRGRDGGLASEVDTSLAPTAAHCFDNFLVSATDLNGDGIPDAEVLDLSIAPFPFNTSVSWSLGPTYATTGTAPLSNGAIAGALGPSPLSGSVEVDSVGSGEALRLIWVPDAGALLSGAALGPLPGGRNAVALGDFNADQVPDLAVVDQYQRLTLLLGTSDGRLELVREFAYSGFPDLVGGQAASGDIDGDGIDDVVLMTGQAEVFLGTRLDAGLYPDFLATGPRYPLNGAPVFVGVANGALWWQLDNPDSGVAIYRLPADGGLPAVIPSPWLSPNILLFPDPASAATPLILAQYSGVTGTGMDAIGVSIGPAGAPQDGGVGTLWTGPSATDLQVVAAQSETAIDLAALVDLPDGGFGIGIYPAQSQFPLSWSESEYPRGQVAVPPFTDLSGFNLQFASFGLTPTGPRDHLAAIYTQSAETPEYQASLWILDARSSVAGNPTFTVIPLPDDVSCYDTNEPGKIHASDIDGDGFTDLLVFQGDCSIAYLAWGQADGGFSVQRLAFEGVGLDAFPVHLGGAGLADIAEVRIDIPVIQLLHNNGDRTFGD